MIINIRNIKPFYGRKIAKTTSGLQASASLPNQAATPRREQSKTQNSQHNKCFDKPSIDVADSTPHAVVQPPQTILKAAVIQANTQGTTQQTTQIQPEHGADETASSTQQAFEANSVTAQQRLQTTQNLLQNNPLTTNNTQEQSVAQGSAPGVILHSTSTNEEKNTQANTQATQHPAEPRPQEGKEDSRGSSRPSRGPRKDYAALAGVKK